VEPKLVTDPADLEVLAALMKLEPIFHGPQYRTAAQREQLVAPQFWEIGASGRRYSRQYVLETLAARDPDAPAQPLQASGFHCRAVAAGVYLLTYTLQQGQRHTRRTTLWQRHSCAWRMLFHQGTVIADAEAGA
jgi:hypothetical protein